MRILYRQQHRNCLTEVVENEESRTLGFDSHLTQSRMLLADPIALALEYTRCMMAVLLFGEAGWRHAPFHVLMIGLGGGSLAKFLLHHFPLCRMDVVEEDPAMPALARQFFHLPDDPRLVVFKEDGARFMERVTSAGGEGRYDMILVDAYDQNGMAESVYSARFFAMVHTLLAARGVVAINLIQSDAGVFRQCTETVCAAFQQPVVGLPVAGSSNEIFFAGPGVAVWEERQEMSGRAWELEEQLTLNFPLFLQEMRQVRLPVSGWGWFGWRRPG